MKVRLIGDVHGKFGRYKNILKASPYPTIQVGDLGVGFRRTQGPNVGEIYSNPPHYRMAPGGHRFIRGNHDNPEECKKHSQFIPDGTIEGKAMFVGGAVSIDRVYRQEGYSWWPDEELSIEELNAIVDRYLEAKPEIMITHDCPEDVAEAMVAHRLLHVGQYVGAKLGGQFASRTRQAFQSMWSAHRPKLWVFGHWHIPFDHILNGTRFICLPELAWMDVDLETGEVL